VQPVSYTDSAQSASYSGKNLEVVVEVNFNYLFESLFCDRELVLGELQIGCRNVTLGALSPPGARLALGSLSGSPVSRACAGCPSRAFCAMSDDHRLVFVIVRTATRARPRPSVPARSEAFHGIGTQSHKSAVFHRSTDYPRAKKKSNS
jgi:hypothetical protein